MNCKTAKVSKTAAVAEFAGDGTSIANAVVIPEKKSETVTIADMFAWLDWKYPGYTLISGDSKNADQKIYDIEKIKTADGQVILVYFDVSIFYNGQLSK